MRFKRTKQFLLLLWILFPAAFCGANNTLLSDGYSHIQIKEAHVEGIPKGNFIQATIDGHWLSVVFLENLGQVTVEVTSNLGGEVSIESTPTPNGMNIYIPSAGNYIVTFTLANGDIYYGEFEVTD